MSGGGYFCRRQVAGRMGELYANQRRSRAERLADDQCQARSFMPVNPDCAMAISKVAAAAANESGSRALLVFCNFVRTRSGSDGIISSSGLSDPVATAPGSDSENSG